VLERGVQEVVDSKAQVEEKVGETTTIDHYVVTLLAVAELAAEQQLAQLGVDKHAVEEDKGDGDVHEHACGSLVVANAVHEHVHLL
jgi:hypothetical protein